GEDAFLEQARVAMDRGLRLLQLREKSFSVERLSRFAERLGVLARAHGVRLLLNGDAETARALGCDGVHWTAARLVAACSRPHGRSDGRVSPSARARRRCLFTRWADLHRPTSTARSITAHMALPCVAARGCDEPDDRR